MSDESVANILRALHDAVLEAQRLTESEHIRQLRRYTHGAEDGPDLAGKPRQLSFRVPGPPDGKDTETTVDIPMLALMPPTSMRIRDLTVSFQAQLTGFPGEPETVSARQVVPSDPAAHSGPLQAALGAGGTGDFAQFKVTFESADPPEAFARLLDRLSADADRQL
jgi:hypothetical protein